MPGQFVAQITALLIVCFIFVMHNQETLHFLCAYSGENIRSLFACLAHFPSDTAKNGFPEQMACIVLC
jgi:hypothetical protein